MVEGAALHAVVGVLVLCLAIPTFDLDKVLFRKYEEIATMLAVSYDVVVERRLPRQIQIVPLIRPLLLLLYPVLDSSVHFFD